MKLYHINDRGTRLTKPAMTPILKSDSMELGYGNMDLVSLVEQAKKVNVDAVILGEPQKLGREVAVEIDGAQCGVYEPVCAVDNCETQIYAVKDCAR